MTKPKPRNRLYSASYHCKDLIKRREKGQLNSQICANWHISEGTFYRWIKEHEEFKEAHEQSLCSLKASWEDKGIKFMEEGNNKAFSFWKEFRTHELGYTPQEKAESNKNQVYIGNVNLIQNGSKEDLLSFIKSELLENKDVIEIPKEDIAWLEKKDEPRE